MNHAYRHLLLAFIFCARTALAAEEPTLCTGKQATLFSCAAGNKVVSLCASENLSASAGKLVYKYGTKNSTPELEYPRRQQLVGDAFSYSFLGEPKGSSQELAFTIGRFNYTLYVEKHAFGLDAAGVIVEKNEKIVGNLKCDNPFQNENLSVLRSLGLPVAVPRGIGDPDPARAVSAAPSEEGSAASQPGE